jgi:FkbM family methyltransferase
VTFASVSQIGQDVAVGEHFGWRRGGYFVDVGASDGTTISNTLQLERELGWRGICVEPLPIAAWALRQARRCHCVEAAAFSAEGVSSLAVCGELSGLAAYIDRWPEALRGGRLDVRTRTLTSILREYEAPRYIEYLSIDTEGSELEVLRGIDWAWWSFGYITLEHNGIEPRRTEMRGFLEERGYRHLRENQWDDDYVGAP